jgi:hypothetical protein
VTLRFVLAGTVPGLLGAVDERLAAVPGRRYWAQLSPRQVDWSIRHHDEATV